MNRKDDHIKYALKQDVIQNDFDKIRFVHNPLNNISFNEIDTSVEFCQYKIPYPMYINAMTGGTEQAKLINEKLSALAKHFNLPIASGSLSIALKNSDTIKSFKVIRDTYPEGIVIANLGADKNYNDVLDAIKILDANIFQIHLNIVQEMIMPEGDRDFSNYEKNIKDVLTNLDIPIIIKEVGFGFNEQSLKKLKTLGAKYIDLSGKGGTNFALIENNRRDQELNYLNSYGLSTVESLLEATKVNDLEIFASGGIRNPFDVIKALALGASAVGMASYFLRLVVNNSLEKSIKIFENFIYELKTIMTILGKRTINELKNSELILDENLVLFMDQRNISKSILYKR